MTNDKKPRGGKRPNSGAKPKYGEPTVNITTRVPESKVEPFRQNAKEFLEQFKVLPSLPNGTKVLEALKELRDSFTDEERETMFGNDVI